MTFEEFAAEWMPGVLRFAAVLAGDRATAEDLAQEVLIRAYSRWDRIGCLDRPELYVRKMVLNEFLGWRRRSSRQIPAGGAALEPASPAPDHAQEYTEREALLAELSKLPRRQRAVLVLRYYEDRGDTEIAERHARDPDAMLAAIRASGHAAPAPGRPHGPRRRAAYPPHSWPGLIAPLAATVAVVAVVAVSVLVAKVYAPGRAGD